jgi:hypothetical protein
LVSIGFFEIAIEIGFSFYAGKVKGRFRSRFRFGLLKATGIIQSFSRAKLIRRHSGEIGFWLFPNRNRYRNRYRVFVFCEASSSRSQTDFDPDFDFDLDKPPQPLVPVSAT